MRGAEHVFWGRVGGARPCKSGSWHVATVAHVKRGDMDGDVGVETEVNGEDGGLCGEDGGEAVHGTGEPSTTEDGYD